MLRKFACVILAVSVLGGCAGQAPTEHKEYSEAAAKAEMARSAQARLRANEEARNPTNPESWGRVFRIMVATVVVMVACGIGCWLIVSAALNTLIAFIAWFINQVNEQLKKPPN